MAKKRQAKTKAKKPLKKKTKAKPSKRPSPKKKSTSKSRPKTARKSKGSKKRSKVGSYDVVALDAKTLKVLARPKKGVEVFFGIRDPRGKVNKIESEYPQRYSQTDLRGLSRSLKSATPDAFLVYQQITRTPDYEIVKGKKIPRYRHHGGQIILIDGKPQKVYRYKLTGKRLRTAQRTVIMGVKGYLHATGIGFTPKTKTESQKGVILVPVGRNKGSADIVLRGDTIKDTVKNIRPNIGSREMVKKGIERLGVSGHVSMRRPINPYGSRTPEFRARQAWIDSIWGKHERRDIPFGLAIDRLANFSDALSTAIRGAISAQGLRFTSLVNLQFAEARAEDEDQANRDAGRRHRPKAGKIIQHPTPQKNVTAADLIPLRPEGTEDQTLHSARSKANPLITISLSVKPI